jgi:hypothetical protein
MSKRLTSSHCQQLLHWFLVFGFLPGPLWQTMTKSSLPSLTNKHTHISYMEVSSSSGVVTAAMECSTIRGWWVGATCCFVTAFFETFMWLALFAFSAYICSQHRLFPPIYTGFNCGLLSLSLSLSLSLTHQPWRSKAFTLILLFSSSFSSLFPAQKYPPVPYQPKKVYN